MPKIWDSVSFVKRSNYRELVLKAIEKPSNPTKLKKELNIDKAHVSRALQSLIKKKWVICLTPKVRKTKLYQITKSGIEIEKELERVKF